VAATSEFRIRAAALANVRSPMVDPLVVGTSTAAEEDSHSRLQYGSEAIGYIS
jgi:hypothetical protein